MELNRLEAEFRTWLKSHLIQAGCEVTNIESSTKNGIPDTFFQHRDFNCWLELKAYEKDMKPLVRKEQRVWLIRHANKGGKGFLICYDKSDYTVSIYHPIIEEVEYTGKYLRVLDPPLCVVHKKNLFTQIQLLSQPTL